MTGGWSTGPVRKHRRDTDLRRSEDLLFLFFEAVSIGKIWYTGYVVWENISLTTEGKRLLCEGRWDNSPGMPFAEKREEERQKVLLIKGEGGREGSRVAR